MLERAASKDTIALLLVQPLAHPPGKYIFLVAVKYWVAGQLQTKGSICNPKVPGGMEYTITCKFGIPL